MNIDRCIRNIELKSVIKKTEVVSLFQFEFSTKENIAKLLYLIKEVDKITKCEIRDIKMAFILIEQEIIDTCNDLMRDFNDEEGTNFGFIMNIDKNIIKLSIDNILLFPFVESVKAYMTSIGLEYKIQDEKNYLFY